MLRISLFAAALVAAPAAAQQQQAGNEASTNTEETFQTLVAQCDDAEVLMLRARIRLQLPRTTEAAAAEAQALLEEAFATCGEGDVAAARTKLADALSVAEAGVDEKLGAAVAQTSPEAEATEAASASEKTADADKPWWQFW
ncbi:MAG: hypothetical protein AAFP67_05460 [Pseudomonadota bacterium]